MGEDRKPNYFVILLLISCALLYAMVNAPNSTLGEMGKVVCIYGLVFIVLAGFSILTR